MRTVDKYLKILIEEGLLIKINRVEDKLKKSNLYTIIEKPVEKAEPSVPKEEEQVKDEEVEQKLPIIKQAKTDEVGQNLHEGSVNIALGGGANSAHRTIFSSLTKSKELNPYLLSDDDTNNGFSFKEIENTEEEVVCLFQSKELVATESLKPSSPEDRKWLKEYFCERAGLYTVNELTGEKIYSSPEPPVVQNLRCKEIMGTNTRETAKAKVDWFFDIFLESKRGRWIKNVNLNVFVQQLPNYEEYRLRKEKRLAEEAEEKKRMEEEERKNKEEQETILLAKEKQETELRETLNIFNALDDKDKVSFFYDYVKGADAKFHRNENDFTNLLPEQIRLAVCCFDTKKGYQSYKDELGQISKATTTDKVKFFYERAGKIGSYTQLYITVIPEELKESVLLSDNFEEFMMWKWNEEKLKELEARVH